MAVKGYFRAPRLHGRRKQQQAERPMIYGGGEESPSAALLGAAADEPSAAAVPKGCFAVYVGAEEARRRFVVPTTATSYLRQPAFRDLRSSASRRPPASASPAKRRISRPPPLRRAGVGGPGRCSCSKAS